MRPTRLPSSFVVFLALAALAGLLAIAPAGHAQAPGGGHPDALAPAGVPQGEEEPDEEPVEAEAAEEESEQEADPDDEGEDEGEKWDVTVPPGPASEVTIDVRRGTWMSLDLSPDGTTLVFDLLGDLYTLPLAGGEATPLASGFAWDMQPRWSPDGRSIAFTSDRSGGDNIWLIRRGDDGAWGEPEQVTEEKFRLVNSPAWSPDGEWIAARKHFVSRRSLGAGEIWLYHRSGSSGLQLTERPNDQKDVGEPVFSPDGRFVYFSQDTTPGAVFQYNKDPNPGIYSVRRLDREDGDLVDWIGGAGGAVRPTPSPDGERVAFLRRVRAETTLWLKDVASGAEWQVAGGLDRDMQETWAIHGTYPTMAWTPDSGSLVYWAGGEIRRVDVASGELATVPFHVRATKQLTQPLRFPVEVAPETFETKMLRWVRVSPAGDRVVWESLGKLWVRDLPGGEPRRLTTQQGAFELHPSWSRDGRSIVYVSWVDEALAAVRVAPAAGRVAEGRAVTRHPGHYAEPVFSPDGRTIVFRKLRGGGVVDDAWSADPGLYRVAADGTGVGDTGVGGEITRIVDEGIQPQFAAALDRVYYLAFEGEGDDGPKRTLKSVELDGSDPRSHVRSATAVEVRVSPDGRWLAWIEGFHAYVAPLVATGGVVDIGPQAKNVPVARVSKDAGAWLHWSGDSATLHWSLGPALFRRALPEAFAFLPGAPEELPEPPAEPWVDLSRRVASDVPAGTIALVGGRVVTMRGDEVIEDGVVVVQGNRIAAVGRRGEVAVPAGAREVDVAGRTLVPGIVDVHWHGPQGSGGVVPQNNWINLASLAYGVTTIHDPSNDTSTIFAAAELARAGEVLAPRIYSTGTILYGAFGDFKATIDSLEDARRHVARMKAVGAISVKSYNQPRRDQRQQVIQAARELGMMVVPEGGSLLQHNLNMVADGHTGIEHSIPAGAVYDDVLQFWGATPVGYTPTLVVGYGGLWGENYWYATTDVWEDERLLAFVPREEIDARSRRRVTAPEEEWGHFANARTTAALHDAGVPVQIGAHGQREGLAAHWEIWMLEQGGMTPHEALRAATLDGAAYLGMDGDLGSIEVGKLADVLVIDGNPLVDVRESREVEWVMLNGRLYDAATLHQVAPEEVERAPFWWQRDRRTLANRP
jgi:imidazolonepropionase-like amidohydrolase/Tol biopolymer transport system component